MMMTTVLFAAVSCVLILKFLVLKNKPTVASCLVAVAPLYAWKEIVGEGDEEATHSSSFIMTAITIITTTVAATITAVVASTAETVSII